MQPQIDYQKRANQVSHHRVRPDQPNPEMEETMAIRQLPDPALLRKLLRYEPLSGNLYWLPRTPEMFCDTDRGTDWACRVWNSKNAGKRALASAHGERHLAGGIFGERHLAHRVVWAIHYGVAEFGMIDHIDGDGTNNRIGNLRLCNSQINTQTAKQRADCSSGVTGVHWHVNKRWGTPRWVARIQCGKRRIRLGAFDNLEDAKKARRDAEIKYGFGPVHGKVRDDQ